MHPAHRSARTAVLLVATAWLLCPGLASPAGLDVDVMYDTAVDFSTYTTYRWQTGPRDDSPMAAQIDERIKKVTDADLAKKGLRLAAADESPQLLLTYYGGIEDNLQLEGVRYEVAPHVVWTGAAPLQVTRTYRVGTLILDFADAGTETVVWSGVVSTKASTSSRLRDRLEKAVRKVLRQYPPE